MKVAIAFLLGAAVTALVAVVWMAPEAPPELDAVVPAPDAPAFAPPAPAVAEEPEPAPAPPARARESLRIAREFRPPEFRPASAGVPAPLLPAPPAVETAQARPQWPFQLASMTAPPPMLEPEPNRVTLVAGTLLTVRLVDALSSERNQPGDVFHATLDQPLIVDGFVIAERGANAEGRVVTIGEAGRVKGSALLAIELTRFETSDGQSIEVKTARFERMTDSEKGKDARKIGTAAAIGAAIGGIFGGGKGAAIGAAIGGGARTGEVLATRGQPATLDSETRISFRLDEAVTITEQI